MDYDDGNEKKAWIVVISGISQPDRSFRQGVLESAREHGFPRVLPLLEEAEFADIYTGGRGFRRGPLAVLGHVRNEALVRRLASRGIPCAFFGIREGERSRRMAGGRGLVVDTDHAAVGRMAADYLAAQGRYAAYGFLQVVPDEPEDGDWWWAQERRRAFEEAVRARGGLYAGLFPLRVKGRGPDRALAAFRQWLDSLPRPLALFACNDFAARDAASFCDLLGCRVPDDIAILGVDNDPAFCASGPTGISSIELGMVRVGRSAMDLMADILHGRSVGRESVLSPPSHVVERASTASAPQNDRFVGKAVDFISANASRAVSVDEVTAACGTSRRFLERRFRTLTGRTILGTIHAKRLAVVCDLLRNPEIPVSAVADLTGFPSASALCDLFRRTYGCTMRAWRGQTSRR